MSLYEINYHAPENLNELLDLKSDLGAAAAILAGGTDLVVRMKQGLSRPEMLLSLKNLDGLTRIETDPVHISIGAGVTLDRAINDPVIVHELPGLVEALTSIGHPACQHHTATVIGNLVIQPRCWFYNQSSLWRQGLDRCFKNGGQACLAVPESKECSSANQSDGAPMAVALSGQVRVASRAGDRLIPVAKLYSGKGEEPFTLATDEIVTHLLIPRPVGSIGQAYEKITYRSFMDYPLVSAAASIGLEDGAIDRIRLVLGSTGPAPVIIDQADTLLKGQKPKTELIAQLGAAAQQTVAGLMVDNVGSEVEYRRDMVAVAVRRAL